MNKFQKKFNSEVKKFAENHQIYNYNKAKKEYRNMIKDTDEICEAMGIVKQ